MQISSKFRTGALYAAASTIALSAGALLVPLSASAQTTPDQSKSSAVSEVIVTAQKRSENLQTVPVAITAFTAKERDRAGIVSAQDQMNFTPGVTYDPSTDHLDIRGVGKVTTYIGTDPGVAVYQDGFYVEAAGYLNQTSLELDRTEVLRGPQGTLYGRNSIGGAVNAISRRPDDEYNGEIRATWNDYVGETVEARVSGPVTDWLKLSAYFEENDQEHNYFTNVPPHTAASAAAVPVIGINPATPAYPAATCASLNFASVQPLTCASFRGTPGYDGQAHGWITDLQASWNAGSNFDGWVKVRLWNEFTRPNADGVTTAWDPIALTVPSVFYGFQGIQQPGLYNPRAVTENEPNSSFSDNKQIITQDTWHAPGFDVKFIGGFFDTHSHYDEDGDAVPSAISGTYEPVEAALSGWPDVPNPNHAVGQPPFVASPYPFPTTDPKDPLSTIIDANNLNVYSIGSSQSWSTELNIASTTKGPLQWLAGLYYFNQLENSTGVYQEVDTPEYDNVTDYLFNGAGPGGIKGCFPVISGGVNINSNGGTSAACPLTAFGLGTVAQVFSGYSGLTPSTVNNDPGGQLDKIMHSLGVGSVFNGVGSEGCLYCSNAFLQVQSQAVFAQLDWKPTDQWHVTIGGRYSWDEKQGYEQEIDVFWIPLVATQAEAQALGFPMYPANWPDPTLAGKYVQDYVGSSCSTPGIDGIQPYNPTPVANAAGGTSPQTSCPAHRNLRDTWAAPTGTAGVEWTPNTDTTVYVRYNRGYKSGGFNLGALVAPVSATGGSVATAGEVGPEYLDDFEGGWKQSIGHTFQFDIAAFYYLYHGLQANNATIQNSHPTIVLNELVNIAQSHAWGVELEAKWSPIENLLILANYSYLNTTNDTACTFTGSGATLVETNCFIDSANPQASSNVNGQALTGVNPVGPPIPVAGQTLPDQPQGLKGNVLPYSPAHKVSGNVSYTFKFEPGDLTLSAVENWHTSFYDNLFSTQEWLVPQGYTTDFRVTWASHSGKYQVIGTVSNAFNQNVLTAYSTLPPSNAYYAYNALQNPRIFTVELRYKF